MRAVRIVRGFELCTGLGQLSWTRSRAKHEQGKGAVKLTVEKVSEIAVKARPEDSGNKKSICNCCGELQTETQTEREREKATREELLRTDSEGIHARFARG